jgi:phage tail sheath gpL-like
VAITSVISDSNRVPGTYTLVSLGVGVRSSGGVTRHVVCFGNMTSAGAATVGVEYDVFSEDDARALFGAGSELFLMCQAAILANPGVALKAIAITESAGAAATGTIVYTGPATSSGTRGVTVLGEEIQVAVNSADTATVVGAAVAAAINAKTDWPVTATAATGTVTITAKNKGPRGNSLAVRERNISGTGIAATPPATGYLTSGASSDDPQAALDAIASVKRRYLVSPYQDATNLTKFKTHVNAEKAPEVGHRKQCVFASIDTLANTTTVATGLNEPRMQCAWQYLADQPPSIVAAAVAARRAARESTNTGYNFDGEIVSSVKPHYLKTNQPINSQLVSALNNGITPLQSANDGSVSIVRSITTRSRDSLSNVDYRVLDTSKVSVPDDGADRFELTFADRYVGFNASQDPPDGAVAPSGVLTPSLCRDTAYEILSQMESEGLLEVGSVEARKAQILFELSTSAAGRFNGVLPMDVIEGAHQYVTEIRQVG